MVNDTVLSGRHQSARTYAAAGWPIFPCRVNDKRPAGKWAPRGFINATNDVRQVDAWYAEADYNFAYEPERVGLCIIDLDVKDGVDGVAAWEALEGDKPETYTVATPSGGRHLYYRGSLPSTKGRDRGGLAPGVDTRGFGGYALGPGSRVDGKEYIVVDDATPQPLPQWLVDWAAKRKRKREPLPAPENFRVDHPRAIAEGVTEAARWIARDDVPRGGNRNDTVMRFAMRLHGLGLSQQTATTLIEDEYLPYGEAPDEPVDYIVASAYRSALNPAGSELSPRPIDKYGPPEEGVGSAAEALVMQSANTRSPQMIEWLWPGWLARGKFHVLGGQKGAGKSTLCFDAWARLTVGGKWPDGSQAPCGDVLIWSGEDDFDDTILPRFLMAGGDPSRLYPIENVIGADGKTRAFDPAFDMGWLLDAAAQLPNLVGILIDPVVSASAADSHKNSETRRGLQPLVDFGKKRGAAVLGVTHFTKNTQGKAPIERITGTLAFGALPRIVWGAVKSDDEEGPRRLVRIASNIGTMGGGFEYRLQQRMLPGETFTAQNVLWGSHLTGSAQELIDELQGDGKVSELFKAMDFLTTMLQEAKSDGVPVRDLKNAAIAHSLTWRTVERAKQKLGTIRSHVRPFTTPPFWVWIHSDFDIPRPPLS